MEIHLYEVCMYACMYVCFGIFKGASLQYKLLAYFFTTTIINIYTMKKIYSRTQMFSGLRWTCHLLT